MNSYVIIYVYRLDGEFNPAIHYSLLAIGQRPEVFMLFKDDRFGLFLHYGIYSVGGWHEQEQWRRGIPKDEYVRYAGRFCPSSQPDCVDRWLSLARDAGMTYVCFTTKHHDGFCLWDTAYTDYSVMHYTGRARR